MLILIIPVIYLIDNLFNSILKLFTSIILCFLFFSFFSYRIGWERLVKKYEIEKQLLDNLFLVRANVFINYVSITGSNIGVSDKGLYLSFPFPIDFVFPALLIPWDEISYGKINNSNYRYEDLIINFGNPRITQVLISSHTINKIHEKYG